MVNAKEKHRANTWAKCNSYITWHHKQGTLEAPLPTPQAEELTILEISYHDQEVHIGDYLVDSYLVASISFDHDNYQDLYWRVLVNGNEIYRDTKPALCYEYIKQQYKQGTLPIQEQLPEEEALGLLALSKGEEISPLHPALCSLSSSRTGNEIMAQIFAECEKFGFEILDDGIYQNDVKLGEVGCTDGNWWFVRAGESLVQVPCNSAIDGVCWLSKVKVSHHTPTVDCEELLDRPFDQLTPQDWECLRKYEPTLELVTA